MVVYYVVRGMRDPDESPFCARQLEGDEGRGGKRQIRLPRNCPEKEMELASVRELIDRGHVRTCLLELLRVSLNQQMIAKRCARCGIP